MFKVSAPLAVGRPVSVTVGVQLHLFCTFVDNRLYGHDHAGTQRLAFPRFDVIWYIWVLVDAVTNAVSGQLLNNAKTVGGDMRFDSPAYVPRCRAGFCRFDAEF